jgi:hypothetical protein
MHPEEGALLDAFVEAFAAIDLLVERQYVQSALVVLYSTIDAAAWLGVNGDGDVTRTEFVNWTEAYLLPDSGLRCTGLELYAARCGVLHSLTAFSRLSRKRKVRTIGYARGVASADWLNEVASLLGREDIVGVHVDDLRRALRVGMRRFLDAAAFSPDRWQQLRERAKNLFSHLPVFALDSAHANLRARDA